MNDVRDYCIGRYDIHGDYIEPNDSETKVKGYEVYDSISGRVFFRGTRAQCLDWVENKG